MVMSLDQLDRILDAVVVEPLHHRHINEALEEFGPGGRIPTTENLAAFVLRHLESRLPDGVRVHRVRVQEDRDLWSDVYGDGALDSR